MLIPLFSSTSGWSFVIGCSRCVESSVWLMTKSLNIFCFLYQCAEGGVCWVCCPPPSLCWSVPAGVGISGPLHCRTYRTCLTQKNVSRQAACTEGWRPERQKTANYRKKQTEEIYFWLQCLCRQWCHLQREDLPVVNPSSVLLMDLYS